MKSEGHRAQCGELSHDGFYVKAPGFLIALEGGRQHDLLFAYCGPQIVIDIITSAPQQFRHTVALFQVLLEGVPEFIADLRK